MSLGLFELSIVILIAAALGIIARLLKQPVILAYVFAGIIIGAFGASHLTNKDLFQTFSELGIMFLLFLIGLEINYVSLRLVGKTSVLIGLGQIILTFIPGFFLSRLFHFNLIESAYLAACLTFSSTIIVVKLLSEKRDIGSLYGKISVGMLLVQDFFAIMILTFLAGVGTGKQIVPLDISLNVIKGIILFAATFYLGRKILPLLFHKIARSEELLFLSSLAWCLGIAMVVSKAGFPVEIGGFLAGLALANSSEHFQIASRIRSLRDFFILVFFVILGSSLVLSDFSSLILPIIVFSLFVLIGHPLIVLIVMGLLGYKKRTSFLCGVTIAQISEFSLILAALGVKLGHLGDKTLSLITATGIITIIISTYFIMYADKLFRVLSGYLAVFERKRLKEKDFSGKENKPIILIGFHRTGQSIGLNLDKKDLLVIDFDPEIISQLRKHGFDYIFGDIADLEIFEQVNFNSVQLVISTDPDFQDNLTLLSRLNVLENRDKMKVIIRAESEKEAEVLYDYGANYVLLPHFTSGQYLGKTIAVDTKLTILEQLKKKDLELMEQTRHIL